MQEIESTPDLRFSIFSEPWSRVKLNTIVKVNQGLAILTKNRFEKDGQNRYSYITIPFLLGGKCQYIENPSTSVICDIEDIIVTRTGSGVGQIWKGVHGVFHNNFFKVVPINNNVERSFLYYYLNRPTIQKLIRSFAGVGAIPDLNHSEFYLLPYFQTNLHEQQKIADFLTIVNKKIQALEKKKALLEQYKKGVMQKIFKQEIRFKQEDGSGYPEWEEKRLGDIVTFSKGKGISKSDIELEATNPCIRYGELYTQYGEVIDNIVSHTNLQKEGLVLSEANDVIIPSSGETNIDIATASCVLYDGIILGGDLNIIKSKMNGVFLAYYMNSHLRLEIAKYGQGVSVVHLYSSHLKLLKLLVPSLNEQNKIANSLSAIDDKISVVTSQINKKKEWKKIMNKQNKKGPRILVF